MWEEPCSHVCVGELLLPRPAVILDGRNSCDGSLHPISNKNTHRQHTTQHKSNKHNCCIQRVRFSRQWLAYPFCNSALVAINEHKYSFFILDFTSHSHKVIKFCFMRPLMIGQLQWGWKEKKATSRFKEQSRGGKKGSFCTTTEGRGKVSTIRWLHNWWEMGTGSNSW